MHGFGWGWHRDHHHPRRRGLEHNDRFPIVFAAIASVAIIAGASLPRLWFLVPFGIGVTLYGLTYGVVHELAIHQRLGWFRPRGRFVRYLADAHAIHHRTHGAPYGMLWPVIARERQPQG
jgi:beta-carotene 3-hydroxylase